MFNKIGEKFTTPVVEQLQTAANSNSTGTEDNMV